MSLLLWAGASEATCKFAIFLTNVLVRQCQFSVPISIVKVRKKLIITCTNYSKGIMDVHIVFKLVKLPHVSLNKNLHS